MTFYLHENQEGMIKLLTTAEGRAATARNVEPAVGEALARPERPPEDHVMITESSVRLPYAADGTRIDSFAGLVYREESGAPILNYRSAHAWGREIDARLIKESAAARQNQYFTLSLSLAAAPVAASFLGGGYAAYELTMGDMLKAALIGGVSSTGLSAGVSWFNGRSYSLLEDGPGDFALGAIAGVTGGLVSKIATGYASELAMNYALNTVTDAYVGGAINGQSWKDAFGNALVNSVSSTAIGFGVARVGSGIHWLGSKMVTGLNRTAGFVRPDIMAPEAGLLPDMNVLEITGECSRSWMSNDPFLADEIAPLSRSKQQIFYQVLRHLANGTEVSKELARRIVSGTLKIRFSVFTGERLRGRSRRRQWFMPVWASNPDPRTKQHFR